MKVLWLASWYPTVADRFAGDFIQRHAIAVAREMSVTVIHVEMDDTGIMNDADVLSFHQNKNPGEIIISLPRSKAIFPFNKLIDHRRHINAYKGAIREYVNKEGLPSVVHVHVAMKAGIAALWMKRKYRLHYLVTEHWTIYDDAAPDNLKTKNIFFRNMLRRIFREALLVLPVSDRLGQEIYHKVYPVRWQRVLNAVDTRLFYYKNRGAVAPFTFIHVSVMNSQKMPEGILRAFGRFVALNGPAKLYMVGPYTPELKRYAESLEGVGENTVFTGAVPYENVARFMQESHILLLFSRFENMPCVILEALCCGLPVISSDVGGIAEVIDEKNGVLIPAGDEESLFSAMCEAFLNRHQYNCAAIAENAAKRFSYEEIGKQIGQIYRKTISKQYGKPASLPPK